VTRTYRCPYCPAEYPTEILARVHVSYAEDSVHEGRDGMTPEVEPVECDPDGAAVGTAFTLAGQLNLHALSLADMPASYDGREFDERERRALLVAALNAGGTRVATELHDRVGAHLDEHGFDPLSADELEALCGHVFGPDEAETGETGAGGPELTTAETRLRDLTPLQQAILLAHLASPDTDGTDLAARVGAARSYPSQVIDTRSDLVARLRSRLDATSLERLVADRVPAADLEDIRGEGYLDAFDIDLAAAHERKRRRSDPTGPVPGHPTDEGPSPGTTTPVDEGEDTPPAERERHDDAVPGKRRSEAGTPTAGGQTQSGSGGDGDEAGGNQTGGEGETVSRAEVEAVREQVAFDLAVVEQEMELADPTPQQVRTKAYLEQILERLDEVLS
jgi:hypothetical protein